MIAIRRPVNWIDSRISVLSSDSVRNPCAIVVFDGSSAAARTGIDVDPLMIAGRVGELVDARLRHLEPVADGDLLADPVAERADVDVDHVWLSALSASALSPHCPTL